MVPVQNCYIDAEKGNKWLSLGLKSGSIKMVEQVAVRVAAYQIITTDRGEMERYVELENGVALDLPFYNDAIVVSLDPKLDGMFKFIYTPPAEAPRNFTFKAWRVSAKLITDANRDGIIGTNEPTSAHWSWGKEGIGAIVLVNKDRDKEEFNPTESKSELAPLAFPEITKGPLDEGMIVSASIPRHIAHHVSIYREVDGDLQLILGKDHSNPDKPPIVTSGHLGVQAGRLHVEAHDFPTIGWDGLISIELKLEKPNANGAVVYTNDVALLRVAPWIMTPHTLAPEEVFVCKIEQKNFDPFFNELKKILEDLGISLRVADVSQHRGDQWMQDEMEWGYVSGPTHSYPVVLDGPRNRGLDVFPETLLGPDVGHFAIDGAGQNSLDSFGNLEVSPPVQVNGKDYPLGRIIFGGPDRRRDRKVGDREMMASVRGFLAAQQVQDPLEIYSDWLHVGHVDEFLSFLPDSKAPKGFRVLFASTTVAKQLIKKYYADGYKDSILFAEKKFETENGVKKPITIGGLERNGLFWGYNSKCQSHLDHAKRQLKVGLGLQDSDFIEIPVLFTDYAGEYDTALRAIAYFPDMVNHLVLGNVSIAPKPYGAIIDGECIFEKYFRAALPERKVYFINDWSSYHENLGEVHCGTNTRRTPFEDRRWWHTRPLGSYNI